MEITCLGCGRVTNTTMCDWADHEDYIPRKCWATWDSEFGWKKGCSYNKLPYDSLEKKFADKYIKMSEDECQS